MSFATAASYWDSQDHWTADNTSIPGFSEGGGSNWDIEETNAVIGGAEGRSDIGRNEAVEYIYYIMEDVIDADDTSTMQYQVTGTDRIRSLFGTDNTIQFKDGAASVDVAYNYSQVVKIQLDNGSSNYMVWVNGTPSGPFSWQVNVAAADILQFDSGTATSAMNLSWVCTDNDGESCGANQSTDSFTTGFDTTVAELNDEIYTLLVQGQNITGTSSANLIYNTTNLTTTLELINESYAFFNVTSVVPLIEINNSLYDLHWEYNLDHENATVTNGTTAEEFQTVDHSFYIYNESYPPGVATSTTAFTFTSAMNPYVTYALASVEYNYTTNYTATNVTDFWTANVPIPDISSFQEQVNVSAYINVSYGGLSFLRPSPVQLHTILGVGLFECSSTELTNQTSLNITLFDEETLDLVTGDIDIAFTLNSSDSTTTFNSNIALSGNSNYALCIFPEDELLFGDAYYEYSATNYDTRLYYTLNSLYSNVSQDLSLYLINSSNPSDVSLYVYDSAGVPVQGAYINVQRYYPATGVYNTVETVLTDNNGLAVASIILNDVTYRFNIDYNSVTVYTTSGSPVYSTELYFYVSLEPAAEYVVLDENDISYYINYNNDTDLFTFFYNDGNNVVTEGCLRVYEYGQNGESLINETCVSSASATITYLLNQTSGTFTGKGYVTLPSGEEVFLAAATTILDGFYETIGDYGTLLAIIVVGTLAFAGMFMAEAVLIMSLVGLIGAYLLGLVFLTQGMLILLLIMAGLIIFRKGK